MNVYGYSSFKDEVISELNKANERSYRINHISPLTVNDVVFNETDVPGTVSLTIDKNLPSTLPGRNTVSVYGSSRVIFKRRDYSELFKETIMITVPDGVITPRIIYDSWAKDYGQNNLFNEGFTNVLNGDIDEPIHYKLGKEVSIPFHFLNPEFVGVLHGRLVRASISSVK